MTTPDQRGSGVAMAAIVAFMCALGLVVAGQILALRAAAAQARKAADLAALAAVSAGIVDGCEQARGIVLANKAVMRACEYRPDGTAIVTTVSEVALRLPGVPRVLEATARAART